VTLKPTQATRAPEPWAAELTARLETLLETFAEALTAQPAEATMLDCLEELRWACAALSSTALLSDGDHAEARARREGDLQSVVLAMGRAVRAMAAGHDPAAAEPDATTADHRPQRGGQGPRGTPDR